MISYWQSKLQSVTKEQKMQTISLLIEFCKIAEKKTNKRQFNASGNFLKFPQRYF